jgi:hypothetical protein
MQGEVLVQPTAVDGPPRLHRATHEPGGSDALTALDAAILTTGVLPDARLSANVVLTTDPRLTNARTPTAHAATHNTGGGDALTALSASILTTGTVPAAALVAANLPAHASRHNAGGADALAVDAVAATGSLRTIGTGALQAAAGNDARFTDARTPTAHRTSHETGGADALTALSAVILTTGTLPDARLSANVLKYAGGYPGGTANYLRADGTFAAPPAGTGDVVGPGSATSNAVALFSGTTGKLLAAGADGTLGGSLSLGTTPATIGALRLANTGSIQFRNAANTANVQGMIVGADGRVAIGSKTNPAETAIAGVGIQFDVDTPYSLSYAWNGAIKYTMNSNGIFPQVSLLSLGSNAVRWSDVCADIVTLGGNASTAGGIRLPNATGIWARNQGNTANVELLNLTNVNVVTVGGVAVTNLAKLDTASTFTAGLGTTPLNATYLTTGTVADARLTANVLKFVGGYPGGTVNFLRADGTFAAPPAPPAGADLDYIGDYVSGTYNDGDIVVGTDGIAYLCVKAGVTTPPEPWPTIAAVPLPLHATSHNAGGGDALTVTSLGGYPGGTANFLRSDGTFAVPPVGALPANVALTDAANSFTQDQTVSKDFPRIGWNNTYLPANSRLWRMYGHPSGDLAVVALDDAASVIQSQPLTLARSGSVVVAGAVSERGRTTAMGEWIAWTPTITTNTAAAITYASLDCKYSLVGKMLFWVVTIETMVIPGGGSTYVHITIPVAPLANAARPMGQVFLALQGWFDGLAVPQVTGHIDFYSSTGLAGWNNGSGHRILGFSGFYAIA